LADNQRRAQLLLQQLVRRGLPRFVPSEGCSVKRVVLLFIIPLIGVGLGSQAAEAQRSGSLQATARVLDTRDSWVGLQSARTVASILVRTPQSSATVETPMTNVSIDIGPRTDRLDRPRTVSITINYLRN
jgi:hypothetical protein